MILSLVAIKIHWVELSWVELSWGEFSIDFDNKSVAGRLQAIFNINENKIIDQIINEIETFDYIKRTGSGVLSDEMYVIPDTVGR